MYENFENDKNHIRVQVDYIYECMISNVIGIVDGIYQYQDEIDKDLAVKFMYNQLWSNAKKYHHKLLLEKLALIVIDAPESVYLNIGLNVPDDLTRLEAVQTVFDLYANAPLHLLLDVLVEILQNENY